MTNLTRSFALLATAAALALSCRTTQTPAPSGTDVGVPSRIPDLGAASYVGDIYVANTPTPDALVEAMRESIVKAGIDPRTISYVEAAAAGLPLGDALELSAMSQAFRTFTTERQFCALGSVKSHIGHAAAASGISQLIKVILQMKHGRLVSPLKVESSSSELRLEDSPFYLQRTEGVWHRPSIDTGGGDVWYPRRAMVNSMGFGGFYAGAILEEYERGTTAATAGKAGESLEQLDALEEA